MSIMKPGTYNILFRGFIGMSMMQDRLTTLIHTILRNMIQFAHTYSVVLRI